MAKGFTSVGVDDELKAQMDEDIAEQAKDFPNRRKMSYAEVIRMYQHCYAQMKVANNAAE